MVIHLTAARPFSSYHCEKSFRHAMQQEVFRQANCARRGAETKATAHKSSLIACLFNHSRFKPTPNIVLGIGPYLIACCDTINEPAFVLLCIRLAALILCGWLIFICIWFSYYWGRLKAQRRGCVRRALACRTSLGSIWVIDLSLYVCAGFVIVVFLRSTLSSVRSGDSCSCSVAIALGASVESKKEQTPNRCNHHLAIS